MPLSSTPIQARSVISSTDAPGDTGVLWRDESTTPPTLRQYDGTEWVPVAANPITQTDAAETFGEADVTVSTTNAVVDNGVIRHNTGTQQTALNLGPAYTGSTSTNPHYLTFEVKQDLAGIAVSLAPDDSGNGGDIAIRDTNGNELATTTAPAETLTPVYYPLSAGDAYQIAVYNEDWRKGVDPYETPEDDYINVTEWSNTSETIGYGFRDIAGVTWDSTVEVSASVEWTAPPTDMYSWSAATFTREAEQPTIYIEEERNGSWTEIAGPINRGADIPAVAGNNIRFRAEWSSTGVLNAVYRRYEV